MSAHFEKVLVKEIRKETADCVSILFDIPQKIFKKFQYAAGQYVALRIFINGEELRRSYSLCSSPLENEWRIAVKKVDDGIFSQHALHALKPGDEIELMPPMGSFTTVLNKDVSKNYTAFVAGSGITPVLSIIKTVLATEPGSNFTLIYGNKTRNSIIFKEELEALKNKYISRFSMVHILSREATDAAINHGRIDAEKCALLFSKLHGTTADEYFICGPNEMIFDVKDFLSAQNILPEKIHFELFTTSNLKPGITKPRSANNEPQSLISVKIDGIAIEFPLAYDGENILDAALHFGADLPYSCKGGVCCTCKAKLVSGNVDMDVHYGLEPDEIAAGYILTCQSHPTTERVVVDFD
jgi:ring-1,2-phenylacetyl-CoA epoxidase subunit PaaE